MRKYMDLSEFVDSGYLQEVNRQFFHPHGLAIVINKDGEDYSFLGVWDARDDQEGIVFTQWNFEDAQQKRLIVHDEFMLHHEARRRLLNGSTIQVIGHVPEGL